MSDTSESGKELGRPEYVGEVVRFLPVVKGSDALRKKMERRLTSPYQMILFLSDLLLVFAGFTMGLIVTGMEDSTWNDPLQIGNMIALSCIAVAFFTPYHLYSYHHLFLKKDHFIRLIKAFLWGFSTVGVVLFLFVRPDVISGVNVTLIFLVAAVVMVLSRFFWRYLIFVLSSIGLAFLAVGVLASFHWGQRPIMAGDWTAVLAGFCLATFLVLLSRYFCVHLVFRKWLRRNFRKHVVIVGTDQAANAITKHVIENDAPFWVSGFVGTRENEKQEGVLLKRRLGEIQHLPSLIRSESIREIIVTDESIDKTVLIDILDYCTSQGITVWFPPKLMPIIEMKLFIDSFCGIPMIRLCSQKNIVLSRRFKHALDALIGLPILLVVLPFFGICAAAIKLTSPGPVFYRAKAIGRDGKPFTMFKFRSMRTDTRSDIHKEYVSNFIKGELKREGSEEKTFKITDDPRVTKIGKLLRKVSLDEAPQILNVLRGDMSLVGPRPCLPYEFEIYKDWHKKRLSIRPGITGLWQVAGRSAVTFEEMVILDLYYIYNRSLLLDLNILYETIYVVLMKRGAY
ncbi:MAG: exopolysaccharide biosynthesis polyprenyl glycosylphosphotransferase [Desulfobacteraceae bacterium]|nr:MAG: exopolysaccharide biosynthesis polyprenyl glycosylphosphotransferase [Desulfobacteraceae bacterium]